MITGGKSIWSVQPQKGTWVRYLYLIAIAATRIIDFFPVQLHLGDRLARRAVGVDWERRAEEGLLRLA